MAAEFGGFRFERDPAGIDNVTTGPEVAKALDDAAARALTKMKAIAPRGYMGFKKSLRRIGASSYEDPVAYVGSDSPVWHLQEFGTAGQSAHATLRRGMKSASGIVFKEGSS